MHLGLVVVLHLLRLELVAACGVVRDRGAARGVTRVGPMARGQVVAGGVRALAVILLRLQICSVVVPAAIATTITLMVMVLHLLLLLVRLMLSTTTPAIKLLILEGCLGRLVGMCGLKVCRGVGLVGLGRRSCPSRDMLREQLLWVMMTA